MISVTAAVAELVKARTAPNDEVIEERNDEKLERKVSRRILWCGISYKIKQARL